MNANTLERGVAKASKSTQRTIGKVIEVSDKEPLKAAFLTRVIEGLIEIANSSDLADVISADSNYEVLLAALETPEALSLLTKRDPLARAKLRGLKIKQQLIEAEGGCTNSEEIAEILGISRQAVNQRRQRGTLIGLSRGKGKYVYPLWQFTDKGKTLAGLETVLEQLSEADPWTQVTFFLNPNLRLENKTPLEVLRMGEIKPVVMSAAAFANDEPD
ncbi:HTH domain-containing protein [Waterburya agarophytonicola K14]|uniref:HTH domain-containing protein n=1 Tax=Waterburya agarophytonicola KI4 TaxID=2874699 RepID=A0A964FHR3_9CYAN|nr:HTH domain-containing protein [Waterburya agarophytonicola]MCC0179366.1 HTH domain-containing protein [Waterburya agarophytonicola KI4]